MLSDQKPTHVRYYVVGLTTAMAVLLYLDRIFPSLLERYIREDLGLSDIEWGWFMGLFFLSYGFGQVPGGWLADRFGPRNVLALFILAWSIFANMGAVHTFLLLVIFRFMCGLAQAGAYPTAAGIVSKWVPFSDRGKASSIIATGGRLGGFGAQVLTAYLLVMFVPVHVSSLLDNDDILDRNKLEAQLHATGTTPAHRLSAAIRAMLKSDSKATLSEQLNEVLKRKDLFKKIDLKDFTLPIEAQRLASIPDGELTEAEITRRNRLLLESAYPESIRKIQGRGWRATTLVYGLAGLLVAAGYWWVVRNRPADHPRVNAAERQLIEAGLPAECAPTHGQVGGIPWGPLLCSRNMWLSSISQFWTNFSWVFLITLLPRYLDQVHEVPVLRRGWLAGIPLLVGMLGMLAGGWLTDRLVGVIGLRWGRRLPLVATRFLAMAAFMCVPLLPSAYLVTIAFCVVAIGTDLGTASLWAFNQDVGGKHVGSVLGWGNMWGAAGAFVSPVVLSFTIKDFGWNPCFLVCAAGFFFSGITGLGIDATVPLEQGEPGMESVR